MNDMGSAIVPKSDQLNADDLLTGPITIRIREVAVRAGQEQPVSIFYENDNGKPYKPCKSMCRALVAAWGPDASKYAGRSLTLYTDPKVRWGGMEVGGIRISHMSDIPESLTMALTVTRGNKKPFTVRPIPRGTPKAATTQTPESARTGAPEQSEGRTSASSAAPREGPSDDEIIKSLTDATDFDALTTAADLARSITDPATKERASAAYKSTLARVRDQAHAGATSEA